MAGDGSGGAGGAALAAAPVQERPQQERQEEKQQDEHLVERSKEMAQHLRHDPPKGMDGCGFVPVNALVEKMEQPTTPEEVVEIVESDDKGRYQLLEENGDLRVRAVQGHSVPLKNPLHDPIKAPEQAPVAVHATSLENWQKIQESGELLRMNRQHIHFASEPKHLRANEWACILLKVDLKGAIEAGIPFCKAANGVVLSEGPIPTRFVHRVKASTLLNPGA
ncbi:hypothetical protein COHA_003667 [Chlorella ohadii]|uniref:2'-phosphotransferase n=1 Tax=Chlorella ohadii TaxID=2649997 RepID=A0AAD5DUI5_9CHLO|nr:hypothetical protein COHA_003667 [Chlorella ohadii]